MKEEIRHREPRDVVLRRHVKHLIFQLHIDGIILGMRLIDLFAVDLVQHIDRVLAAFDQLLDGGLVVLEDREVRVVVVRQKPFDEFLARVGRDLDLERERLHVAD